MPLYFAWRVFGKSGTTLRRKGWPGSCVKLLRFERARLLAAPTRANTSPALAAGVIRLETSCCVGRLRWQCVCPQGLNPPVSTRITAARLEAAPFQSSFTDNDHWQPTATLGSGLAHYPTLRHLAFLLQHHEVFGNQLGVPQAPAGFLTHRLRRLFMGESRLVRACRTQCVVNVHDLQNAG